MHENVSNKITNQLYYAIQVELASPLCISSGEKDYTNMDVLRNGEGELFIPGTSLAGAFSNALCKGSSKEEDEQLKEVFGHTDGRNGKMSAILFSDLYFEEPPLISVRDRIQLIAYKEKVQNKFDMQIIEPGVKGTLYLQCVVREQGKKEDFLNVITESIQYLQNGEIRLGSNKNRGFGRLRVLSISQSEFTAKNVKQWIDFNSKVLEEYQVKKQSYQRWMEGKKYVTSKYIKISVPLKLNGGISIRRYSTRPNQADYEHITAGGKPVIPGNSWNGAMREDARRILHELGCRDTDKKICNWFGYVPQNQEEINNGSKSMQSMIVVEESIIEGSGETPLVALPIKRIKVNRFSNAPVEGAFYSEISYFGGTTSLEIMIKKDDKKSYKALIGLLHLVIWDITEGFVAVGGQVAIGRGIFEANGEVTYSEMCNAEECLSELYTHL